MSALPIAGVILRNVFLIKRSWHRLVSLFYWTTMVLILWGIVTVWLRNSGFQVAGGNIMLLLVGALLFWEIFVRIQHFISTSFFEEIWTHNVLNIFASPLRLSELIAGFIVISVLLTAVSFLFALFVASLLYALHIWELGFYLIPFMTNIFIFGWAIGFVVIGCVIRFGPSFEIVAWMLPLLIQPLSAVFYPVSILPPFLQKVAWFLPTSHLFEGMRNLLSRQAFQMETIWWASFLSVGYFVLALFFFAFMVRSARQKGLFGRYVTD